MREEEEVEVLPRPQVAPERKVRPKRRRRIAPDPNSVPRPHPKA